MAKTDLLTGDVRALTLKIAAPSVAAMLAASVCPLLEALVLSARDASLSAAVGASLALILMEQTVGFTLGMGAGSFVSRCIGQGRREAARRAASTAFFAALGLSALLLAAGLLFAAQVLRLLGAPESAVAAGLPYARAGGWIGEQLGAHAVGHPLMADGRKAGEHAGQIRDVQAAPDRAHAAQPILRGAHQVERRAGENAHFPVRGEQPQQGGHARAVRNQPPGGAEVIALGVEGIGLAAGKRLRVVFAEGDGEAHAVAVGQIRPGRDAAGNIAGADGKRREDKLLHDIVKRAVCRALHRRARRARAEVGIMKGLAGSGGQPVVGVFQQLAQGAALLHAARAVIPLVADGGGMGEQHAQGDGRT